MITQLLYHRNKAYGKPGDSTGIVDNFSENAIYCRLEM
jgi:hypothetical protein